MAEVKETDLVVLGGGPGGYAAAFLAADKGMKVTLIDARDRLGGTCLNVGCIPSKALLHTAKVVTDARDAARIGLQFAAPKIDVNAVRGHAQKVVETLTGNLGRLAKARKIDYVAGKGRFLDGQTVQVEGGASYRFKNCIVATGSIPTKLPWLDLPTPRVMDSTGALELEGRAGALPGGRRRLHRPGNGLRLRRPGQQGHGRRADRRPPAGRGPRPGEAAAQAPRRHLRQNLPQYEGGEAGGDAQGDQGGAGRRRREGEGAGFRPRADGGGPKAGQPRRGAGQGRRRGGREGLRQGR